VPNPSKSRSPAKCRAECSSFDEPDTEALIFRVAHPEEPSDPFASFASDVAPGPNGPGFWVDMADAEAYDGILEEALGRVLAALAQSGVTEGCLTWPEGTCETTTAWEGA